MLLEIISTPVTLTDIIIGFLFKKKKEKIVVPTYTIYIIIWLISK